MNDLKAFAQLLNEIQKEQKIEIIERNALREQDAQRQPFIHPITKEIEK